MIFKKMSMLTMFLILMSTTVVAQQSRERLRQEMVKKIRLEIEKQRLCWATTVVLMSIKNIVSMLIFLNIISYLLVSFKNH